MSDLNKQIFIAKYNELLKIVIELSHNVRSAIDIFKVQYSCIQNYPYNEEITKALESPAILSDIFLNIASKLPDVLKIPSKQDEINIETIKCFFVFRKYLEKLVLMVESIKIEFEGAGEIKKVRMISICEILNSELEKAECFEYKNEVLLPRIIVENPLGLSVIEQKYGEMMGKVLYDFRFTELSIFPNQIDDRKVTIVDSNKVLDLVFEDEEQARRTYTVFHKKAQKDFDYNLKKIEEYLEKSKL